MKHRLIIALDILLAIYLVAAVTAFNRPETLVKKCTRVQIDIADETLGGFLDQREIQSLLERRGLYPLGHTLDSISPRRIERLLAHSPFVSTAQCARTTDGHILITVTQREPLVRIKSDNGDDYYLDGDGGIMPNSRYTQDLIIVTGSVSRTFARRYVHILMGVIMADDFWRNQIEQVRVRRDLGIDIVPRVGDHTVFLGYLPRSERQQERQQEVSAYVERKLRRLKLFYRYGLSVAGWNKYESIDLEYDNQIICRRRPAAPHPLLAPAPQPAAQATTQAAAAPPPAAAPAEKKKQE